MEVGDSVVIVAVTLADVDVKRRLVLVWSSL